MEQHNSQGRDWSGFHVQGGKLWCADFSIPGYLAARIRGWSPPSGAWADECERMRLEEIAHHEAELKRLRGTP